MCIDELNIYNYIINLECHIIPKFQGGGGIGKVKCELWCKPLRGGGSNLKENRRQTYPCEDIQSYTIMYTGLSN